LFGALRSSDYRVLLACLSVYSVGLWTYRFGLGWLVVQIAIADGSTDRAPLYLGAVGFATAVPGMCLSLIAGAVVDRFDLRRILVACQVCGIALSVTLAWLTAIGSVSLWAVLVLVMGMSAVSTFDDTVKNTLVMRIVPRETTGSAIGLDSMRFNATQAVGPALGGLLLTSVGLPAVLLAEGAGYLALTGIVLFTRPPGLVTNRQQPLLASVLDGLRYVRDDRLLRSVVLLGVAIAFFTRPSLALLPAFVEDVLGGGASHLAGLMSAVGVGSFIGAVVLGAIGVGRRPGLLFIASMCLTGATLAVFAVQREFSAALAGAVVLGMGTLFLNGLQNAILQIESDARMLGRVIGIAVLLFYGVIPLGQLALGALGSAVGIQTSFVVGGAVTFAGGVYAFARVRSVRDLELERAIGAARPIEGSS